MNKTIKNKIYKVQVPIAGGGPILIYDKSRRNMYHLYETEDMLLLMGDEPKKYFLGHMDKAGVFQIVKEVEEQSW